MIPMVCNNFFTFFSNETRGPKKTIKSSKSKFVTPKVGEFAESEVKVLHFCLVLPALQKTNNAPENQKTKNEETKKNKKTKKEIAHPKWGVVAESWVLSFCFFCLFLFFCVSWFFVFWILMLFSHCRKINNEPETKNLKNQKKTKKNKIAHPKGGVVAESWILSFCFFWLFVFCFLFFVFF